jgi:DNA-binding CsgD family transcriptional regulator
MNCDITSGVNHDRTQIGIVVESDFFVRGLLQVLKDGTSQSIECRVLTPAAAINEIKADTLDVLILDTDATPNLFHVLNAHHRHPRVILVSRRHHVGIRLPLPKCRICCFYSDLSSEWEMKHFLNVVLPCRANGEGFTGCENCEIRYSLKPRSLPLSRRESEVFKLIGLLQSNSEIAEHLDISVKTVEAHCTNIKRKMDLANSRQLLQEAVKWVDGF